MESNNKILVIGASGNLGSKVAANLISLGREVRVNGRCIDKLNNFKSSAEIYVGNIENEAVLKNSLEGVGSIFLVLPKLEKLLLKEFSALFIESAQDAGVSHVVNISNCTLSRWGKPTALLEFEAYLDLAQGINIKHLRCANFFENLNWGINTPYKGDVKLPYISSFEIAHTAAQYLANKNFIGTSVDELMGRTDYTMEEFAGMLGVKYKQLRPKKDDESFFGAFNTGNYELVERTKENTSKLDAKELSIEYFLEHHFDKTILDDISLI